jgi:CxxC motif-containing protein
MVETMSMICITCPKGCTLDVTHDGQIVVKVDKGCKRGAEYVQRELTDPRRMVASTVKVAGGLHPLVPVYTEAPFPKPRIRELLAELRQVLLIAPVQGGTVVLADALGTGINIIASRDMPEA